MAILPHDDVPMYIDIHYYSYWQAIYVRFKKSMQHSSFSRNQQNVDESLSYFARLLSHLVSCFFTAVSQCALPCCLSSVSP